MNVMETAAAHNLLWANIQPWEIFIVSSDALDRNKKAYQQKYAEQTTAAPETPRPAEWSEAATKRIYQLRPDTVKAFC